MSATSNKSEQQMCLIFFADKARIFFRDPQANVPKCITGGISNKRRSGTQTQIVSGPHEAQRKVSRAH